MATGKQLSCPDCDGFEGGEKQLMEHMRSAHRRDARFSDADLLNEAYALAAELESMEFANPRGVNQYNKGGRPAGPPKLRYRDGVGLAGKKEMKTALRAEARKYR